MLDERNKKEKIEAKNIWIENKTLPSLLTSNGNIFKIDKDQFIKKHGGIDFDEIKKADLALLENCASKIGEINSFTPFLTFNKIEDVEDEITKAV